MSRPLASSPVAILLESLLLAICYAVFAHLGLYLAIPPGFASAVWLPSGVALAGVLWRGNRIVGGVLLGSFVANLMVTMRDGNTAADLDFWIPAGIAVGATLQTVLARLLIRRFVGLQTDFFTFRSAFRLIVLGGPVACLVSATWGHFVLYTAGMLAPGQLATSWLTWWIGDSLGVLSVAPILTVWLQPPPELNTARKGFLTLPVVILFAAVALVYTLTKADIERKLADILNNEASALQSELQKEIDQHTLALTALRSLFLASENVTEEEFTRFFQQLDRQLEGISALEYAPYLSLSQLKEKRAEDAARGLPPFTVTEINSSGVHQAAERDGYQPVLFVAPRQGNESVIGLDLLSEPSRREAVERALRNGDDIAAAGPITLVQGSEAYLLISAIDAARSRDVVGDLFFLDSIIAPFNEALSKRPLLVHLYDETAATAILAPADDAPFADPYAPLVDRRHIGLADRRLLLTTLFTPDYFAASMNDRLWPVLTAGFVIVGSLSLLIIVLMGAQISTERLVGERSDELRQERRFLDSLIDHLPLMLYVKDARSRQFVRVNKRGLEFLGKSESDLLGKTEGDVFGPDHERKYLESDLRAIATNQVVEVIDEEFSSAHGAHWLHTRKVPITDASGNPLYLLGLTDDVTSRVLARRKLEQSERRNALILNSVGEGIYGIDRAGICTFINPAACDMLGYAEDEILGKPMHAIIHAHHGDGSPYPKEKCPTFAALADGKPRKVSDETYWRKDGSPLPVEYVSTPLIDEDEMVGSVVIFSDISKRQELDRLQLEHTKRLEMINEDLEEFSYIASHDIQEPLRTLSCFTEFLVDDIGRELPSQAKLDIEYIKKASQRIHALINDMLAYSRAGRTDIKLGEVSLAQCIKRIQEDLMLLINDSDARVSVRDLPVVVGDETQLTRIFVNLIQNAIKFRSERSPKIDIDSVDDGDGFVTVRVRDNGIGIEPQYHEHVFGAFRKLHDPEQYPGSGIGLAVVKKLVERHGGTVRIDSRLGEGTTVLVRLRKAGSASASPVPEETAGQRAAP